MDKLITIVSSTFASLDGDAFLINILLQITLLAALALLVCAAYRKHAIARYNILFSTLLGLVVMVTVSIWMQSTGYAIIQFDLPEQTRISSGDPGLVLDLSNENIPVRISDSQKIISPGISSANRILESDGAYLSLTQVLVSIWIGGFALSILGLQRSLHQIGRIADSSRVLTTEERAVFDLALGPEFTKENPRVRIASNIPSPVLAGLITPVLLLPNGFLSELKTTQLREVLIHELAHVKRKDCLANFAQKLILSLFWFHPLVHAVDRELSKAREEICDNYVLQEESALDYGETLLAITSLSRNAQSSIQPKNLSLGIISHKWNLEDRIRELLDTSRSQTVKLSIQSQSFLVLSLVSLSIFISGCQLQAAEQRTPSNQDTDTQLQMRTAGQDSNEALQRRNASLEAALVREQLSRSLTEIQSLLEDAETELQERDLTELMQRIFTELETRLADDSEEILGEAAANRLAELADGLDTTRLDREELMRSLTRLQSVLELGNPSPPRIMRDRQRTAAPLDANGAVRDATLQVVKQVQELMSPSQAGMEPDLASAKRLLDEHRRVHWESLNNVEKSTLLNFYTNYWLTLEDYSEAINTFEELLTLENLEMSTRLRTLRSLGQLYMAEEHWEQAISRYQNWRELSLEEDTIVFRGLSYSNYQLEQYPDALPYWQEYMNLSAETGVELGRDDYAYLNGLYFTLEMYEEALENTKEMIVLFNDPTDWRNLRAVQSRLGINEPQAATQPNPGSPEIELQQGRVGETIAAETSLNDAYLPLVAIQPQYPARAASEGIEGWVLLTFAVNEEGRVVADSITVKDSEPANTFNRSAIRAAQRLLYNPRVKEGIPLSVDNVQYLFRWSLNSDA